MSNNEELQGKIVQKLENALNNREQQLESLRSKLSEQARHAEEVREKALKNQTNNSMQQECA